MASGIPRTSPDSGPRAEAEKPQPRTAASYERELTELRNTGMELRTTLARQEVVLREQKELIERQKLLGNESDHRLLNGLQIVASLLSLQSRTEVNAEAAAQLSVAANRVAMIARIHRRLHSLDGKKTAPFRQYLDELCLEYATMLASDRRPDRTIVVQGIEMEVPTATAIPLGLIANELVTNAIKHGTGRITVMLEPSREKGHALSVANHGPTLPPGFDPVTGEGLGMGIVSALAAQIGGELRFDRGDDEGSVRFAVLFP